MKTTKKFYNKISEAKGLTNKISAAANYVTERMMSIVGITAEVESLGFKMMKFACLATGLGLAVIIGLTISDAINKN